MCSALSWRLADAQHSCQHMLLLLDVVSGCDVGFVPCVLLAAADHAAHATCCFTSRCSLPRVRASPSLCVCLHQAVQFAMCKNVLSGLVT
jgi:hypothetical protein